MQLSQKYNAMCTVSVVCTVVCIAMNYKGHIKNSVSVCEFE